MNRDLWFKILQVAVVAPYVYYLSKDAESDYFRFGLKMVAGAIVFANARPILVQVAPLIKTLADATATASRSEFLSAKDKDAAVDVEFVNKT